MNKRKIDIYVDGKYVCSMTQRKTCKEAISKFIANPVVQTASGPKRIAPGKIAACFSETQRRRNPRVSKTEKEYVIQAHYGQGWEDVNYETTRADARRSIGEYRYNQPGAYRIIVRRVPKE